MSVFLEHDHGWGQQRVAARVMLQRHRTQVGGNVGGLPLSVAGMRPSKTGTNNGERRGKQTRSGFASEYFPDGHLSGDDVKPIGPAGVATGLSSTTRGDIHREGKP